MAKSEAETTTIDQRVEDFATDLGRLLGTAKAKADNWLGQRGTIVEQLAQIRDTTVRLLGELAGGAGNSEQRRPASPIASNAGLQHAAPRAPQQAAKRSPRGSKLFRRKRTFSAETRERMRQAQLKRWAAARKATKK